MEEKTMMGLKPKTFDPKETYPLIIENINDLIAIIESQDFYRFEYINEPLFLKSLGYKSKDLIEQSILDFMHPDDSNKFLSIFKKNVDIEAVYEELRIKNINGEFKWFEFKIKPFRDDNQQKKLLLILKDLSKYKNLESSEETYRIISEHANDLIAVFNEKLRFEFINEEVHKRLLGYSKKDLMGKSFLKFIHPDNVNEIANLIKERLKYGEGKAELRYKKKDGTYIWIEVRGRAFRDKEGLVKGLTISREITDRMVAKQKLKESEEKFRTIFKSIPDLFFLLREDTTILDYSGKEEDFYIPPEEFMGKKMMNILPPELGRLSLECVEKTIEMREAQLLEYNLSLMNEIRHFEARFLYFSEDNVAVFIRDITERKNAEQKLKESEKNFRRITEYSLMGILEYDFRSKKIKYTNPKLLNILGYEKEKTLDKIIFEKRIHPEDIKKFYKATETEVEFRLYDKNGNLKWVKGNRLNQYNEKGELIGFVMWMDDITEKKMYERLIYELNVNFLNFTTDVQNNIEMLLETCCKLLNAEVVLYCYRQIQNGIEKYQLMSSDKESLILDPEEFKNNFIISELFQADHDYTQTFININETNYAMTDRYIKEKRTKGCFGKLIKAQEEGYNSGICVFHRENPYLDHQDVLVLFLISDAIEIEQRRWQVQQYLEEQNKLKTELLSRTSHELKTPLISIKGFTDLLLTLHSSKLDTDMISIIEDIKEGGRRLEENINALLESSRLEQGLLELNKSTEDLTFLIKFVLRDLRGMLELRNQKIILNIHEYLTASFDKERMYEVVSNLLTNAIKYTPPGGEITIKSEIKEKFYIICVEDNGIGFTEEEKSKLFKQFGKIERYGEGWDIDIQGSGLGLYISKKIVELHGGKIWAESEGKNKGSRFYFSLPII
ncbi:MAG: PAS domain S-box protein [Candidatus Thorarchaeota archaeon]